MDPLSEVLSLLELKTYVSGGFLIDANQGIEFGGFHGMKCYAVVSGRAWVSLEGSPDAICLNSGDCILLARGLPFVLASEPSAPRIPFSPELTKAPVALPADSGAYVLGGHFVLNGKHSDLLLHSLPGLVVLRQEASKRIVRWSLDCLGEELRNPQPGGSLIAQQLASILLVHALRSHSQGNNAERAGWLFALSDPAMRTVITCMHSDPGHPWTLQEFANRIGMSRTVFAQRFRERVGMTPMEYLTRWRMMIAADRLRNNRGTVSEIASSVGYEADSAFGRSFKRMWGYSPRQYRRAIDSKGSPTSVSESGLPREAPVSSILSNANSLAGDPGPPRPLRRRY